MGVVLIVVAGLAVFAIAAAVIGREAHRLDAVAPRAVYDQDEAVTFVADHLPEVAQARLTSAEVAQLLRWHLRYLWQKGLLPAVAEDQVQDIATPVVVAETTVVGYLLGEADGLGMDVLDEDVALVVDAHLAYFDVIGAVGPEADDPDVPDVGL